MYIYHCFNVLYKANNLHMKSVDFILDNYNKLHEKKGKKIEGR